MNPSVLAALRRRRLIAAQRHALLTNDALFDAGRDLRRRAQERINAGDPQGATPFIAEAELFESAITPLPDL